MKTNKDNIPTDPLPSTKNEGDAARVNDGNKPDNHRQSEKKAKEEEKKKNPELGNKTAITDETTI